MGSGGPPLIMQSIDDGKTSSVKSNLYCDVSKSRREDLAANGWLEIACISDEVPHHGDRLDTTSGIPTFSGVRPPGATFRPH
jgi:hypothetical protein